MQLDAGVPVENVVVTGGLPHAAPALIQDFADFLQLPVAIHPSTQGPAVGAAVLGGMASGQFASIGEAVAVMSRPASSGRVVEPRLEMRAACDALFERYQLMAELSLADQRLIRSLQGVRGD